MYHKQQNILSLLQFEEEDLRCAHSGNIDLLFHRELTESERLLVVTRERVKASRGCDVKRKRKK